MLLELMTWYKKWTQNQNDLSMHVTFGDDGSIPDAYVNTYRRDLEKHDYLSWKKEISSA